MAHESSEVVRVRAILSSMLDFRIIELLTSRERLHKKLVVCGTLIFRGMEKLRSQKFGCTTPLTNLRRLAA